MVSSRNFDTLLSPVIEAAMRELVVPGALVHVRTGSEPPLHKAYGYRDVSRTTPMTVDDHVRVGSNTKTMTGTVVLKLVEQQRLGYNDPLSAYRPDVQDG